MRVEHLAEGVLLYLGDCRDILPSCSFDAVVTDPPWDRARGIAGADDPRGLFNRVATDMARARVVAIQLGCYCDPSFLAPLAGLMPFIHVCWLRYVPPSYNGRVLVDADVAYVYGEPQKSREGARVIPSTCQSVKRQDGELEFQRGHGRNRTSKIANKTTAALPHPMSRRLDHVIWLIGWHTEESDVVADPFMGSGTTGVSAVHLSRRFIGIEIEPRFFDVSCRRIAEALKQTKMVFERPSKQEQLLRKLL
jgi:hypothetical protein